MKYEPWKKIFESNSVDTLKKWYKDKKISGFEALDYFEDFVSKNKVLKTKDFSKLRDEAKFCQTEEEADQIINKWMSQLK